MHHTTQSDNSLTEELNSTIDLKIAEKQHKIHRIENDIEQLRKKKISKKQYINKNLQRSTHFENGLVEGKNFLKIHKKRADEYIQSLIKNQLSEINEEGQRRLRRTKWIIPKKNIMERYKVGHERLERNAKLFFKHGKPTYEHANSGKTPNDSITQCDLTWARHIVFLFDMEPWETNLAGDKIYILAFIKSIRELHQYYIEYCDEIITILTQFINMSTMHNNLIL